MATVQAVAAGLARMTADRRRVGVGLAIFSIALAVRLLYVLFAGNTSVGVSADARGYHDIALNLITRHHYITTMDPPHRLDFPYAIRPPLTPFFLAAVYSVTWPSWRVGQVALAFVGAIGCVLVGALGSRLFGPATGLVAGLLASVYPFFVFLASVPLTENLAIPLHVALVLLLIEIGERGGWRHAVAAGVVVGLLALNKPSIFGFIPLLAIWLLLRYRRVLPRALGMLAIILVVSMAVIAPWTFRNFRVVGGLVPVTIQGGWTMYAGVGPPAEYSISLLENGAQGWYFLRGAFPAGIDSGPIAETDREMGRRALAFILEHPRTFLNQAWRKLLIFWGAYPYAVHKVSWAVVAVLSLIGVGMTARHWRTLVPIYLLILQTSSLPVLFSSMPRFRAPIEPFLLVFAAVPLVAGFERAMGRRRGSS